MFRFFLSQSVSGKLIILVVSGVVAGCGVLEDYIQLQRPDAHITGVGFQNIGLESLSLRFDVEVENPYSVALPLVNLDYNLSSRSQQFLSGASELEGSVPAGGRRTIQLPAKITYASLINTLSGIRPGSVVPYAAELGLSVDAPVLGRLRLPLVKEGELPVPTVPEVSVSEVHWEKLTLTEAVGRVRLDMVNNNQFPIDLSTLNYQLSLAGVQVAKSSMTKTVSFNAGGGTGTVDIPISFSPTGLGMGLLQMLTSDQSRYQFHGNLAVKTPFGPMMFPLEATGSTPFLR